MESVGNYLVEIIKAGGPMALWGIGIWLVYKTVSVLVVCLAVYSVARVVCKTIRVCHSNSIQAKQSRIHLISQQVSDKLSQTLDTFLRESGAILKDIQSHLDSLKKDSTKK